MKKLSVILFAVSIFVASCTGHKTCPTYTKDSKTAKTTKTNI